MSVKCISIFLLRPASRNYHYTTSHHYTTSYNRWYQKPRRHYYYSSSRYNNNYYRGKRDTEHPEMVELKRIKREVEAGGFDINNWYRDMTEVCRFHKFLGEIFKIFSRWTRMVVARNLSVN